MFNGYPSPAGIVVAANITGGAAATNSDAIVLTNATTTTVRAKGATTPASCRVVYTRSAAANTPPVITSTLTNCN